MNIKGSFKFCLFPPHRQGFNHEFQELQRLSTKESLIPNFWRWRSSSSTSIWQIKSLEMARRLLHSLSSSSFSSVRFLQLEEQWRDFFSDPSHWWDNRLTKRNPKYPDFVRKSSKAALWIDDWRTPVWVKEKIAKTMAHPRPLPLVDSRSGSNRRDGDSFSLERGLMRLCDEGRLEDALEMADTMIRKQADPLSVNLYARLLRECVRMGSLEVGKRIHTCILLSGLLSDVFLCNNVINMYIKCGSLKRALEVFEEMPQRNAFSWAMVILAVSNDGRPKEALCLFKEMRQECVKADVVTFLSIVKACASLGALEEGKWAHAIIKEEGFESNIFLASALVDMYAKCGSMGDARWVFDGMQRRDVVSWNSIIAGYINHGDGKEAFSLFERMQLEGLSPDKVTFLSILKTCTGLADLEWGKQVHACIKNNGLESDAFLLSTLIDMYAKCGSVESARQMFDRACSRDVVTWNAMIVGYSQHGRGEEALALFEEMQREGMVEPDEITITSALKACASLADTGRGEWLHACIKKSRFGSNVFVGSALVDMYAKCGRIEVAREVFDSMRDRGVVAWNAMYGGYAQHGLGREAFALFEQMQREGVKPDEVTFISLLKACATLANLERGKQVHVSVKKNGLESAVSVGSALIDMYAKCGSIEDARQVFDGMQQRNVVTWNTMIAGYAQHGPGKEALAVFEKMRTEGVKPDEVTFVSVLSACRHEGLVDEARHIFDYMSRDYCIVPTVEHYSIMVNLLGRLGHLAEAEDFINKMPIQPSATIWKALLGACRIHGDMTIGKRAFEHTVKLEPKNAAAYVVLSNIYAAVGRKDEVAKVRKAMEEARV